MKRVNGAIWRANQGNQRVNQMNGRVSRASRVNLVNRVKWLNRVNRVHQANRLYDEVCCTRAASMELLWRGRTRGGIKDRIVDRIFFSADPIVNQIVDQMRWKRR